MQEKFYKDVICNRHSSHRYWKIEHGRADGMGGLTNIEWENGQAEISLIINPQWRGNGFGREAVDLLLDQAFNYLRLELVYGECYTCNPAMGFWEKVCKKYQSNPYWLNKGKYWQGTHYGTMYFDFLRANYYEATNTTDSSVQPA
jgi:GNAT superfamily N-acetyltransferase